MRTNLILFGVAAMLAVPTTWTFIQDRRTFKPIEEIPQLFPGFTEDFVSYVVLSKPEAEAKGEAKQPEPKGKVAKGKRITFAKQSDGWVMAEGDLAGVPARKDLIVDDILQHVHDVRRDKVLRAGADDEYLKKVGLDDAHGILVQCLDASQQPMAEIVVGKKTSEGRYGEEFIQGYYVRRKDGRDVLIYEPSGYWNLSLETDGWVDKKIHEFDANEVTSFRLKNQKGTVTFTKKKGKWVRTSGPEKVGAVRQREVDALVSRFSLMNTEGYEKPLQQISPAEMAGFGLDKPGYEIQATLQGGKTYKLSIGAKIPDKNQFHALFSESRFLNRVGDWVASAFERDPKEYFDPSAADVGPDKQAAAKEETGVTPVPDKSEQPDKTGTKGGTGEKAPSSKPSAVKSPVEKVPAKKPAAKKPAAKKPAAKKGGNKGL